MTLPTIWEYREPLERALQYSGGTHTFLDVVKMVHEGHAQLWVNGCSAAITEILTYPQKKVLHCFLAGGDLSELLDMLPDAARWGVKVGCEDFTMAGRPGWQRVLKRHGWRPTLTLMEISLPMCYKVANTNERIG